MCTMTYKEAETKIDELGEKMIETNDRLIRAINNGEPTEALLKELDRIMKEMNDVCRHAS